MYACYRRLVAVCLCCLAFLLSPSTSGSAQTRTPTITLEPTSVLPGATVLVRGTNFTPGGQVIMLWTSGRVPEIGSGTVGRAGTFVIRASVPPEALVGSATLRVRSVAGRVVEEATASLDVTAPRLRAAFIYRDDDRAATSFKSLLDANGIATTLVPISSLNARNSLVGYDFALVGADTGDARQWASSSALAVLRGSGKPLLGIGAGGAVFFGQLGLLIGGRTTAQVARTGLRPVNARDPLYTSPARVGVTEGISTTLFTEPVSTTLINLPNARVELAPLGQDTLGDGYAVAQQGNHLLWGFSGTPVVMTELGKQLLINALYKLVLIKQVDTLILTHPARMTALGYNAGEVEQLTDDVTQLANLPRSTTNMTAIVRDLGSASAGITSAYANWDTNAVASTNTLVAAIDSYIENLKKSSYTNIKYVLIVGAHEIIPMKARAADNHEENKWADALPRKSGYFYNIYHSKAGGANGYYLTDSIYSDLSYKNDGWGNDHELVPELAVGRLVETPTQISAIIGDYIAAKATLRRANRASLGSADFMDGAQAAANAMGSGTDTALIQEGYTSTQVPPKINAKHDVVFIAGHGNYNSITTRKWDQGFIAGSTTVQGDTEELGDMSGAVVITDGCHNGVNFGDRLYAAYDNTTTYGEFPERFAAKQAAVFVGSTGYTWISGSGSSTNPNDAIYSERVAALVVDRLMNDGATTVGEAFQQAINAYVAERGTLDNADRRAIAITTLYGIPTYKMPAAPSVKLPFDYKLERRFVNPLDPVDRISEYTNIVVNHWRVIAPQNGRILRTRAAPNAPTRTQGVVEIAGAASLGGVNTPDLPVVTSDWVVPVVSGTLKITLDPTQSVSTTIDNDIPLPVTGTSLPDGTGFISVTGTFTATGFYPAQPFFTSNVSNLGDAGTKVTLGIVPVQYNKDTHQTRIWTKLAFKVEIVGDAEAQTTDADGDTLPDFWEQTYTLDPNDAAGDNGATSDPDGDGLTNAQEYAQRTNPHMADSDRDGVPDNTEVAAGTSPRDPDAPTTTTVQATLYLPLTQR